jgi:hypothetical protein
LEQRSREAGKGESRIGFARHKPTTHKGDDGFGGDGCPTLHREFGGLAERRAATNLLAYQSAGRDVLNVQRTKVVRPIPMEGGRLFKEQQLCGAAVREENGVVRRIRHAAACKAAFSADAFFIS